MPQEVHLDKDQIAQLEGYYRKGLYLQAYKQTSDLGHIKDWRGEKGRILAGRLAYNLGGQRLGYLLHYRAWKEHPESGEAIYFYARALATVRGSYRALRFIRETGDLPENTSKERKAEWRAFEAYLLGRYRDFDNAEKLIAEAKEIDPNSDWIELERASLFEFQDRYDDALEVTKSVLKKSPWYRSGVQHQAQLLQSMGRDDEALKLLTEAMAHIESSGVAAQCLQLQIELKQYPEALNNLDLYEKLTPLKDKGEKQWIAGRRSDLAYFMGNLDLAISSAEEEGRPFYTHLAEKLKESTTQKSVRLDVDFVQQHHMTCGPATLTSIAQFWGRKVDHLEVVEDIWYDGTTEYSERQWAVENGYIVREFKLSWDSCTALLDKGIPFALSTVEPGSAHLQAVIGYDEARGVFLVRDPGTRHTTEFFAEKTLEFYAWTGPRAMVLVPEEKADLLDGIELPDRDLYDRYFWIKAALEKNDRAAASAHIEEMQNRWPDHRLLHVANRSIGIYDDNEARILENTEKLLEQFPGNINYLMSKQQSLGSLGRRIEQQAFVEEACKESGEHTSLLMQRAQLLSDDAREFDTVEEILLKLIRWQPQNSEAYFLLAYVRWEQNRFDESIELYRIVSCLEDKVERYVSNYFKALRCRKRGEEGIDFLKDRFHRFGQKSAYPAMSLCRAYEWLDQDKEAEDALNKALEQRPDDADLLLYGSDFLARHSKFDQARGLLERARGKCQEVRWLVEQADLADYEGELKKSLEYWGQVLVADPMHFRAIRMATRLLSETKNRQAAINFLERKKDQFPYHHDIQSLWVDWLDQAPLSEKGAALRRLLELNPQDDWAHRELGRVLGQQDRYEEAYAVLETARQLDPTNPSFYNLVGELKEREGHIEEAIESYREALKLNIDNDFAMRALLSCCTSLEAKKQQLEFIRQQLIEQVTLGDGLMSFQALAGDILEPEELLKELHNAVEQRPDLWNAWAAISREYADAGRLDEALKYSKEGTKRFPLLPRLWLDQAKFYRFMGESEEEKKCLERTMELAPSWSAAIRQLAEYHEVRGDYAASKEIMESALTRIPLDPYCRGFLADALWHLGDRDQALIEIARAVELDPDYDWAWSSLNDWASMLDQPDLPEQTARKMITNKPGDPDLWCILARMQSDQAEKLSSLDKAIELNPRLIDAHEQKIVLLTRMEEYDKARAAVDHPSWNGTPPVTIRGHSPWISRQQGDNERSITEMLSLVEQEPTYYDGYRMLADWYDSAGQYDEYLQASQAMLNLDPTNPHAMSYVGDALHDLERDDEAIPYLQQAAERDPGSTLANFILFDILRDRDDIPAMQTLMEKMKLHIQDNEFVTSREGFLAARVMDRERAMECLQELALGDNDNRWLFDTCLGSMKSARWESEIIESLGGLLSDENCLPRVGAFWGEIVSEEKAWKSQLPRLKNIYETGSKTSIQAMSEYQDFVADNGSKKEHVKLIKSIGDQLKQDPLTWASAIRGFSLNEDAKTGIKWAGGDWREHSSGQGWGLFYMAQLHWYQENIDQALEVNLFGVDDQNYYFHEPWIAMAYFLKNDLENARLWMDRVNHNQLNEYHQMVIDTVDMGLVAYSNSMSNKEAITEIKQKLKSIKAVKSDLEDNVYEKVLGKVFDQIVGARDSLRWTASTSVLSVRSAW